MSKDRLYWYFIRLSVLETVNENVVYCRKREAAFRCF